MWGITFSRMLSSFQDAFIPFFFTSVPEFTFFCGGNSVLGQGTGTAVLPVVVPSHLFLVSAGRVGCAAQGGEAVSILISPSQLFCDGKGVIYEDGSINTFSPR